MYYKITDFKKDLIKTLNKIKKERGNTMDDITIIDNNNDALLLYFSQHYDPNDMKSMNEVGKFYVNILKEIFFLKKKLKNNYHFYNIFKDIMFQEIYQSTYLLFLLNDMYDMIVENLTAKDCLNKSKIIKLYYDRITSEEAYNESLQSFILDKLPEFQSTICDLSQRNDETSSSSGSSSSRSRSSRSSSSRSRSSGSSSSRSRSSGSRSSGSRSSGSRSSGRRRTIRRRGRPRETVRRNPN